ncbi:glycolate oxidase subunit GlcF [Phenylobacterium sp.]|jgi:glycolate oxidase iron-sulfur subunit|uniref:glycolate oxidase subunit GlcF n=1 Tax=Phenylobacterium sp. TaxID=1871053 RepID=UPI002F416A6A
MKTEFSAAQLAEPQTAASHAELRKCVHCGFCTATCPTYVLTGDERDGPRGRIELIKAMLEAGGPPPAETVLHIDRCLSCLGCRTTCPSGVDYAQLMDHGRAHIEAHYRRPFGERLLRWLLPQVLTRPAWLRAGLAFGRLGRPLEPVLEALKLLPLAALLRLVPAAAPRAAAAQHSYPPVGQRRGRVALLQGCVEPVLTPTIRDAAIRLLTRAGYDVVLAAGEGCCGALSEHLGRTEEAAGFARRNLRTWERAGPFDAIVTTAAGCGTTLKAYAHRLPGDPAAASAAQIARDVLELVAEAGLPPVTRPGRLSVAYHAPCSLQHGQGIRAEPAALLAQAGYEVRPIAEGHLCCGSAGVYNILQPQLAGRLRARKAIAMQKTGAVIVAAGNVGCIAQMRGAVPMPVVHPVELLDWATGGPMPPTLVGALGPAEPGGQPQIGA